MQMVPERPSNSVLPPSDEITRHYQALLHAADVAIRHSLPELLEEVSRRVHEISPFDFLSYALHSPSKNILRLHLLNKDSWTAEDQIELSVDNSPWGWAWLNQEPLVLPDLDFEGRFPATLDIYRAKGMRSLLVLPMTTGRVRLGALGFGSAHFVHYDDETLSFFSRITGLVALAVENSLSKESLAREEEKLESLTAINTSLTALNERTHQELQQERDRLQTIVEISAALVGSRLELQHMFPAIAQCIRKSVAHDAAVANIWRESEQCFEV